MPLGAHGLPDHPTPASSGSVCEVERSDSGEQMITDCFARSLARQRQSIFAVKRAIPFSRFVATVSPFFIFSHDFGESSHSYLRVSKFLCCLSVFFNFCKKLSERTLDFCVVLPFFRSIRLSLGVALGLRCPLLRSSCSCLRDLRYDIPGITQYVWVRGAGTR